MGAGLVPEGTDPRLKMLSYSSLLTLHACPRRFELDKLTDSVEDLDPTESNITFAFGHCVGEGVQAMFQGMSFQEAVWKMLLRWRIDLYASNEKQKKSFWEAVEAVRLLYLQIDMWEAEYELVYYPNADGEEVPAVELSFLIEFPEGYKFRGFMDVALRNKRTGSLTVLEVKTSSSRSINQAQYKNSAQALGYTVVMDTIAPGESSYEVVYLVFSSMAGEWDTFSFQKTMLQRARWIQQVMLDVELIKLFSESQYFPQHGESCFDFYRECKYYGTCSLENKFIIKQLSQEMVNNLEKATDNFAIKLTLADLIAGQVYRQQEEITGETDGKTISFSEI